MLTRRNFLATTAAASVPVASTAQTLPTPVAAQENPALVAAYETFMAARAELDDAKSALEWLADEWRHVWPLAPIELVWGANAHDGRTQNAERDIIGRYLMRDASDFPAWLPAKTRAECRTMCFSIDTAERAEMLLEAARRRKEIGRTEKATAKLRAERQAAIAEWEHKLSLAREYETETARIREAAGVDGAQQRISAARNALDLASDQLSAVPAFTMAGLHAKARALQMAGIGLFTGDALSSKNIIGDAARFLANFLEISEGVSA